MVEVGYRLARDPDTVRAPDVAFLSAARLAEAPESGFVPGAPDLAVEIVSADDTAADVEDRVQDYLRHGARMVLVVHPRTRTLTCYRPDGSARVLQAADTLDGADVVPGFRLVVGDLFTT